MSGDTEKTAEFKHQDARIAFLSVIAVPILRALDCPALAE